MATLKSGTYGSYYVSSFNESESLNSEEQKINALYIYSFLLNKGWNKESISAMLGNMQAESSINPGRWQSDDVGNTSNGYGLVQWTPATKYINWCTELNISPELMDSNLSRIVYEVENNLQWIATEDFNFSFKEFSTNAKGLNVIQLAKAFLLNYERPANQSDSVQVYRGELALLWYEFLTGKTPSIPIEPKTKKQKYKFLLFNSNNRRKQWIRNNSTNL